MNKIQYKIIAISLIVLMLFTNVHPVQCATVASTKYGYTQLNKTEKNVYTQILSALKKQKKEIHFKNFNDYKKLPNIYATLLADNPDIFWVKTAASGCKYKGKKVLDTYMQFTYSMSKDKMKDTQKKLQKKANALLKGMPKDSDYEKVKFIYEQVIDSVSYDYVTTAKKENQLITSAMLKGKSVCAGYTKMYTYLLQKAGIPCMMLSGKADNQSHAWDVVKVDGKWYYSDVTWGDMENKNSDYVTDIEDYTSHIYMLEPASDFKIDHKLSSTYVALPICNSNKSEYFRKEGLYFTEFTAKQRQIVQDKIDEGETFEIKCFVDGITSAARNYLYTLDGVYGLNFDDNRNIITVFVQNED